MIARRHAVLGASVAAVVGATAALLAEDTGVPRSARIVLGVALVGTAGALLGLVQAAVVWIGSRAAGQIGADRWWRSATTADRDAPRDPVIRLHAALGAAAFAAAGYAACLWILLPGVVHVEDEDFARGFGLLLLSAAAIGSALAAVVAYRLLVPLLARVDAAIGLPQPRWPALRWLVWLAVPLGLLLVPYLRRNAEELGIFAVPFWLLVFFAAELVVLSALRGLLRPSVAWARLQWGLLAGLASALVAATFLLRGSSAAVEWTRGEGIVPFAADVLRRFGDVDRDGYSSWLGGGDCAAFDGARNPGSRDVPANGIDENCDGQDAEVARATELSVFSGALSGEPRKLNVVVVIVDAMRWDHTNMGGYKESTTPYLHALSKETLHFQNAYSQSSATMLSIPSILTGRDPSAMDWRQGKRLEPTDEEVTLARRLDDLGYGTGIIAVKYFADFLERMRTAYEHDEIVRKKKGDDSDWYTGRAGPLVVRSIEFIEEREASGKPFFLTLYIPEPHDTYDKHGFGISSFGKGKKALYDGEIANADRHIGFFVEYLKYSGHWDDTILVVTSDHGEEFNEHGGKKHARTCYVESTHVPLIVHVPGVEPAAIEAPVGLHDIVPTILEAIGATDVTEKLDGQSLLVPALAPELVPPSRAIPCAILSQRAKQGNFFRRALRTDKWLLVHEALENEYELYDTVADPKEKKNVYDAHKGDPEVARLREQLNSSLTGNLQNNLLTD